MGSLALALVAGLLAGCAAPPLQRGHRWHVALPVEAAAWILAHAARQHAGGGDPQPWHAGVPAVREADGSLRLDFGRAPGEDPRVAMNGRLAPPPPPALHVPPLPRDLRATRFLAERDAPTETSHARVHGLRARVRAAGPDACSVELTLDGDHASEALARRLRAGLRLGETLQRSAAELVDGELGAAARRIEAALVGADRSVAPRPVVAWLHLNHALALAGRHEVEPARRALREALDRRPNMVDARAWLPTLNESLANDEAAARGLRHAVGLGVHAGVTLFARERLRATRRRETSHEPSRLFQARAEELLAAGERAAALEWVRRAADEVGPTARNLVMRADAVRMRRQHRLASDLGFAALVFGGFDADLLLQHSADCREGGRARLALRRLARNWHRFSLPQRAAARAELARLLDRVGPEPAARILTSEKADDLAAEALALWAAAGGDETGRAHLARSLERRRPAVDLQAVPPPPPPDRPTPPR